MSCGLFIYIRTYYTQRCTYVYIHVHTYIHTYSVAFVCMWVFVCVCVCTRPYSILHIARGLRLASPSKDQEDKGITHVTSRPFGHRYGHIRIPYTRPIYMICVTDTKSDALCVPVRPQGPPGLAGTRSSLYATTASPTRAEPSQKSGSSNTRWTA